MAVSPTKIQAQGIDLPTTVIFVLVFLGSVLFDVSPAVYVVLAGAAGILIRNLGAGKGGK